MAIIDALYLHPGYNLLLEFGWTTYIDNDGNVQSFDDFFTDPLSFVMNPEGEDLTHFDVYTKINAEKKARFGNYEAVFGKISNFKWQLDPDGGYTCNVTITGVGQMIESLKVNIALSQEEDSDSPTIAGGVGEVVAGAVSGSEIIPLVADKKATFLNRSLWNLYEDMKDTTDKDSSWEFTLHNFPDPDNNWESKSLVIPHAGITLANTTTTAQNNQAPQAYMSFGALLALIQCRCLVYNSKGEKKVPVFSFDFSFNDFSKDTNYMCRIPGQMSSDPQTVIIAYDKTNLQDVYPDGKTGNILYPDSTINQKLKESGLSFIIEEDLYVARMAGMYINFNYIAECLRTAERSEDKSISLLSFLNKIFFGIEESLGNINKFSVKVDETTNKIKIYDQSPQRISKFPYDNEKDMEVFAKFNVFGVKPGTGNIEEGGYTGEGSFVTSVKMDAELGSNFASAIVIGAQANGNQLSSDSTGFEKYNAGLEDRVIQTKVNYSVDPKSEEEVPLTAVEFWNYNIMVAAEGENTLFDQIYTHRLFLNESIASFKGLFNQFMELSQGTLVQQLQIPTPSFLPFNLSLEMDGLSGMKLWEKFLIDDRVLPPSYDEDSVDFQVSGINHTVDVNGWKTALTTQCMPKSNLSGILRPSNLDSARTFQGNQGGGGDGGSGGGGPTSEIPVPPGLDPASETRFNAMQKSFVGVFNKYGSVSGMCAQWSYNLALNYCRALKGLDGTIPGTKLAAGGNANQNSQFWANLVKMGYKQTKVGTNIARARLNELIRATEWGYGDVAIYYATDGPNSANCKKYGHAQVYVGELTASKWTTSTKTNYGTPFVYNSKRAHDQWDFYVLRAPSTAGGVGTGPGL